ncbi:MAG: hypothetical protein HYY24_15060 [Verrucomicrobia bacterium]|nr:hypothetical protein [Verrucomicrobiota bacterium]
MRIGDTVRAWQRGVVTTEEAEEWIRRALEPENFIPYSEAHVEPEFEVALRPVLTVLRRIELKLNAVIAHGSIPLPDELDPQIVSEEVRKLAARGEMILAVKVHRELTGTGLAEAKHAIDEYLRERRRVE